MTSPRSLDPVEVKSAAISAKGVAVDWRSRALVSPTAVGKHENGSNLPMCIRDIDRLVSRTTQLPSTNWEQVQLREGGPWTSCSNKWMNSEHQPGPNKQFALLGDC